MKNFVLAFLGMAVLILGIFGVAKLFYPQQPCSHCKVKNEAPAENKNTAKPALETKAKE